MFNWNAFARSYLLVAVCLFASSADAGISPESEDCVAVWSAPAQGVLPVGGLEAGQWADAQIVLPRRGLLTVAIEGTRADARLTSAVGCGSLDSPSQPLQQASNRWVLVAEPGYQHFRLSSASKGEPLHEAKLITHFLPFADDFELQEKVVPDPFRFPCLAFGSGIDALGNTPSLLGPTDDLPCFPAPAQSQGGGGGGGSGGGSGGGGDDDDDDDDDEVIIDPDGSRADPVEPPVQ